ncbi:hypothetical protein PZB74_21275 [Porifericola rhodea]|uniref:hypothetical protein n=1 Tax=Porifericola rhodea TaxID=930972 RepID=UPI0026661587|nr:hypothetical protein [Porifericola rhodea]WKN31484.1 hypothetical protein PZB74_21275 [Porifericola rhodea]
MRKLLKIKIGLLFMMTIMSSNDSFAQLSSENSFQYHVLSPTPINHLQAGKILGVANQKVVSTKVVKGELPEGFMLFDDGTLALTKPSEKIKAGKHNIKVEFIDSYGKQHTERIKLKLIESTGNDHYATVRVAAPKSLNQNAKSHYNAGDVIALFRDPDGIITDVTLIKGALPEGVTLVHNKHLVVTNPQLLKNGEYFCLFITKDEMGGNSVLAVSLPLGNEIVLTDK